MTNTLHPLVLFFFSGVIGCAASSKTTLPIPEIPQREPQTDYYAGTIKRFAPDGKELTSADLLLKRTLDRAASRITEEFLDASFDPHCKFGPARSYNFALTIHDVHFIIEEIGATYSDGKSRHKNSGTGQLVGTPWGWTEWTWVMEKGDGNKLKSQFTLSATEVRGEQELLNSDGSLKEKITCRLQPVPQIDYEKRKYTLTFTPPADIRDRP